MPDPADAREPLRDQGAVGARADRDALARPAGAGHRRSGRRGRRTRIKNGIVAYDALERLKTNRNDAKARADLDAECARSRLRAAAQALRRRSAQGRRRRRSPRPRETPCPAWCRCSGPSASWSGFGFYFIALFAAAFCYTSKLDFSRTWLLRLFLWSLPLPWIAAELGWFVAEYGRQPWAIDGVLPTFLAVSSVSAAQVLFTLCGFVLFYSSLAVVDVILMRKYVLHGAGRGARSAGHARAQRKTRVKEHHHVHPRRL